MPSDQEESSDVMTPGDDQIRRASSDKSVMVPRVCADDSAQMVGQMCGRLLLPTHQSAFPFIREMPRISQITTSWANPSPYDSAQMGGRNPSGHFAAQLSSLSLRREAQAGIGEANIGAGDGEPDVAQALRVDRMKAKKKKYVIRKGRSKAPSTGEHRRQECGRLMSMSSCRLS